MLSSRVSGSFHALPGQVKRKALKFPRQPCDTKSLRSVESTHAKNDPQPENSHLRTQTQNLDAELKEELQEEH